jgi:hypothetical protein
MNTFTISTLISIIGAIALLLGGGYLLTHHNILLNSFLEKVTVIYALLGILITVMWQGINRLNSLDNLEGLKGEHIKLIQGKTAIIKRTLYYRVAWLFLASFVLFVFSSIRSLSPLIDIALSIIIPVVLTIIWMNAIGYVRLYISIDEYRQKVTELCQKEKARRKLIDEMKKDRQSQPLLIDQHLEGYRKVFDDGFN